MIIDGITLVEGSAVSNLSIPYGDLAAQQALIPNQCEIFYRTDLNDLQLYLSGAWASAPSPYDMTTKVNVAGDTMTGPLVLSGDPTLALHAATKQYVDTGLATKENSLGYTPVNKAGDTMTGSLVLNADPTLALGASTKQYVDTGLATKENSLGYTPVNKAGDTMTGSLVLNADPTLALGAATKQYVDTGLATKENSLGYTPVNTSGDTMTGGLNFSGTALRITGDFSNATVPSRLAFQTSTLNSATNIHVIPNGTATQCGIKVESDPAMTNGSFGTLDVIGGAEVRLSSSIRGTGSYLPLTFFMGATEIARMDTSGYVGIGGIPATKLDVQGAGTPTIIRVYTSTNNDARLQLKTATSDWSVLTTGSAGTNYFSIWDNTATERLRIDASGNVGIGGAPQAWSVFRALQLNGNTSISSNGGATAITNNAYNDGTNWKYINTSYVSQIYFDSAGRTLFNQAPSGTAGTTATLASSMVLDASGNLGIGTTPAAWLSSYSVLELNSTGFLYSGLGNNNIGNNAYYDGTWKYKQTGYSQLMSFVSDGSFRLSTAPSGTAGTALTWSESVRIDSSGNVGIGTGTPGQKLTVVQTATLGQVASFQSTGVTYSYISVYDSTSASHAHIGANATSGYAGTVSSTIFQLLTSNTARMTIDTSGNVGIGVTPGFKFQVVGDGGGTTWLTSFHNSHATNPYGSRIYYSGAAPNGVNNQFILCADNVGNRFYVNSNGGVANYSANNVNLSDKRTKKNIKFAGSYLTKLCQIPVRTFLYNDQTDDEPNLGVIAQEVEAVCPELVCNDGFGETPEDGIPLKTIYQTDMTFAYLKAIQELKALNDQKDRIIKSLQKLLVSKGVITQEESDAITKL